MNHTIDARPTEQGYAPRSPEEFNNRGVFRRRRNDLAGALDDFSVRSSCGPSIPRPTTTAASCGSKMATCPGHCADFDEAIRSNPAYAEAWNNRGVLRHATGDPAGALGDFGRALHLRPGYADAHYNRALARLDLGERAEAIEDLEQALRSAPPSLAAACLRTRAGPARRGRRPRRGAGGLRRRRSRRPQLPRGVQRARRRPARPGRLRRGRRRLRPGAGPRPALLRRLHVRAATPATTAATPRGRRPTT